MNDSSWGAPSSPGYWGPPDQAPAPAGPPPGDDAARARRTPAAPGGGGETDGGVNGGAGGAGGGAAAGVHEGAADETQRMPAVPGRFDGPAAAGAHTGEPGARGYGEGPAGPLFRDGASDDASRPDDVRHDQAREQNGRDQHREPRVSRDRAPQPGRRRGGRDLGAAIGVGLGLGAVVLAALFIYKVVFVGVIALAVVVGLWELTSRLAERKKIRAPLVPLAAGGVAMVVAGYASGAQGAWIAMALTALAVLVWRMAQPPEEYLRDVTAGVFAAFYVPFLATFVAMMLAADDGPWRVLTFLILTVVSDTGAYAVGYKLGKHKLAPRISPGKTREGLVGAVTFAMGAGALCMRYLIDDGVWWQGLLLGLAVAASATLGDLGESMIKRDLGIKDMGTLLPGHGGIMDRLDSLLPTAPVVWLLLAGFVGTA